MHIAIVGAGPIGMFAAHRLNQLGINITIIDPRAGHFTRPGSIDNETFETISVLIEKKLNPSEARHIKELEGGLFKELEKQKITILGEGTKFKSVVPGGLTVSREDVPGTQQRTIYCDAILDCSGSLRVVLKAMNELVTKEGETKDEKIVDPPFKIIPAAINPMEGLLLVAGRMEKKSDIDFFMGQFQKNKEDIADGKSDSPTYSHKYILGLEQLRNKFKWTEYSAPFFHLTIANNRKKKVIVYLERPIGLTSDQMGAWVQANLDMRAERAVPFLPTPTKSKKYGHKPRQQMFTVQPQKVMRTSYQTADYPVIIPLGDSQIDPDFRLGHGISNGIRRVEMLVGELIGVKDIRKMNFPQYQTFTEWNLYAHSTRLQSYYDGRREEFSTSAAADNVKSSYLKLMECLSPTEDKKEDVTKRVPFNEIIFNCIKKIAAVSLSNASAKELLEVLKKDPRTNAATADFVRFIEFAARKNKFPDFPTAQAIYADIARNILDKKSISIVATRGLLAHSTPSPQSPQNNEVNKDKKSTP